MPAILNGDIAYIALYFWSRELRNDYFLRNQWSPEF